MEMDVPAANANAAKQRLEALKAEKGRMSRQIGEARQAGAPADELIEALKQVTGEIKRLQKHVKKQLNDQQTTPARWIPPEVEAPRPIGERPVNGPIEVKPVTSQMEPLIEEYVAGHAAGTMWHRPRVAEFVRQTYGHPTACFCALDGNGNLVGLLPMVQLSSRLFGNFVVSMPYFNYGGVLAENAVVAEQLLAAGAQWRSELGADHLELRSCHDTGAGLPQRTDKITFWLPLPASPDDLWGSFQPKLRAQVRRGERELDGLSIGGEELLDAFYQVFSTNMRDLGTPVYGKAFFRNLLISLPGEAWLVVARINGQAVGCAFLTGYGTRMEIPWASTLRSHSHTAINMIMYWRILEFAIEKGFGVFDFGRCSEDAGTYRFKQQWGAQPLRLHWDYILPDGGQLPALNPNNPKFRLLIATWKRLPVWVANLIGPHIVRVLP